VTGHVALASNVQNAATVRWAQGQYGFELRSDDAEVVTLARRVFRPWSARSLPSTLARSWTIQRDQTSGQFAVQGDGWAGALTRETATAAVTSVEFLAVQRIFEGPPDVLTIHSALVSRNGHGVVIAGLPESGKSTLSCALWANGFSLLSDDMTIVDLDTTQAWPAPRRVSLRTPSRALLGETLWQRIATAPATSSTAEGCLFHPDEISGTRPGTVKFTTLIFLGRTGAFVEPGVLRPLPAAQATLGILPYTNLARRVDTGDLIATLAGLVGGIRSYDLSRAPLADMVAAVTRAVTQEP
jgi:hypothetical protein